MLLFALGACGRGGGDDTIDLTHDACAPLTLAASTPTGAQLDGIRDAIALWRARGVPSLVAREASPRDLTTAPIVELVFEDAALAFHGLYDDETGVIYVNRALTEPTTLAIVIAHELGHAFGLAHVTGRASLMNPGNLTTPPTSDDQAALEALWGACADAP